MSASASNSHASVRFRTDPAYADDRGLFARTGLSVPFWRKLRSQGKGPAYLKVGRRVLYKIDTVDRWLEEFYVITEDTR